MTTPFTEWNTLCRSNCLWLYFFSAFRSPHLYWIVITLFNCSYTNTTNNCQFNFLGSNFIISKSLGDPFMHNVHCTYLSMSIQCQLIRWAYQPTEETRLKRFSPKIWFLINVPMFGYAQWNTLLTCFSFLCRHLNLFILSSCEMWVICGVCCFWGQRAEEQTNNPSSPRFTRPHWNSWGRRWRSLSANQNRLSEVNAQTPLLIWFFYSAASLFGSRRNYPKSDLAKLAERLGIGHPSHAQRSHVSDGSFT